MVQEKGLMVVGGEIGLWRGSGGGGGGGGAQWKRHGRAQNIRREQIKIWGG